MKSFGLTDKGKVRKENQDSFLIQQFGDDCLLAVLCDGMGGVTGGSIASSLASRLFAEQLTGKLQGAKVRSRLKAYMLAAVARVNGIVYDYPYFDDSFAGMGTTFVGVVCRGSRAIVLNIGDSRAYLITKKKITQVTRDHSLVEELIERGKLTREQARTHPRKNIITRALGVDPEVEADVFEPRLSKGDRLLLCSDGMSNLVSDQEFLTLSRKNRDNEALCRTLLSLAMERGASDNVTVVVLER